MVWKEIWCADEALKKKYFVGQWIKFQMVDNKPIMEQVHEYENLTANVLNKGMKYVEICRLMFCLKNSTILE